MDAIVIVLCLTETEGMDWRSVGWIVFEMCVFSVGWIGFQIEKLRFGFLRKKLYT